jgi:hypothetical protein
LRAIARLATLPEPQRPLRLEGHVVLTRFLSAILLTFALAGCATVTNTIPADQVATFRLDAVTVGFADGARIWWGDGERAFAATKGIPAEQSETVANTPEAQAFLRKAISDKLKAAIERQLRGKLTGTRPVRVLVNVKDLQISSAIQRIIVGGAHHLRADVQLVDARTGALLLAFPDQVAISAAGQGIGGALLDHALLPDPLDRVVDNFSSQYSVWLLRE